MSSSPIVAALTPTGTPLEAVIGEVGIENAALSLVEVLAGVPDPRHARGIRHSVLVVLVLGACAVLAGARSFVAIGEYAHDVGSTVLGLLDLGAGVPHGDCPGFG